MTRIVGRRQASPPAAALEDFLHSIDLPPPPSISDADFWFGRGDWRRHGGGLLKIIYQHGDPRFDHEDSGAKGAHSINRPFVDFALCVSERDLSRMRGPFEDRFLSEFADLAPPRPPSMRVYSSPLGDGPGARLFFGRGVFNPAADAQPIGRLVFYTPDGSEKEPVVAIDERDVPAGLYFGQDGLVFATNPTDAPAFLDAPDLPADLMFYFHAREDTAEPTLTVKQAGSVWATIPGERLRREPQSLGPLGRDPGGAPADLKAQWFPRVGRDELRPPSVGGPKLALTGVLLPDAASRTLSLRKATGARRAWIDFDATGALRDTPMLPRGHTLAVDEGGRPFAFDWRGPDLFEMNGEGVLPLAHGVQGLVTDLGRAPRWSRWLIRRADGAAFGAVAVLHRPSDSAPPRLTLVDGEKAPGADVQTIVMDWLNRAGRVESRGAFFSELPVLSGLSSWSLAGWRIVITCGDQPRIEAEGPGGPSPIGVLAGDTVEWLRPGEGKAVPPGAEIIAGCHAFSLDLDGAL